MRTELLHERQRKLRSKLLDKVMHEYFRLNGPRIGVTGKALIEAELDLLLHKGTLLDADLHKVAEKVKNAQIAENNELAPLRPSSRCSVVSSRPISRTTTPLLDRISTSKSMSVDGDYIQRPLSSLGPVQQKKINERLANLEWEEKLKREMEDHAIQIGMEKEQRIQKILDSRISLDQQVAVVNQIKAERKRLEEQFIIQERQRKQQWEEERRMEEERQRDKRRAERENLKQQIELRDAERMAEVSQRKQEENDYAQKIADEHKHRRDEEAQRKQREKSEVRTFLKYNAEMSEQRRKQKQTDVEEEQKYLQQHQEYLDKKEKEYVENLQRIANKQGQRVGLASSTYFKSLWELEAKDAERAANEQRILQDKLSADDQKRKQKIMHDNETLKSVLNEQIAERNRVRQVEEEEKRLLRLKLEEEARRAQEEKRSVLERNKISRIERSKELDDQVSLLCLKNRSPMEIKIMGHN